MFSCVSKAGTSCLKGPCTSTTNSDSDNEEVFEESSRVETRDPLLWTRELGQHCYGDYSFAIVQANQDIEDHSHLEIGRHATFVGVFDGHGGYEASRFSRKHLFTHLIKGVRNNDGTLSEDLIRNAVSQTENDFIKLVRAVSMFKNQIIKTGTCCLAGVIWEGTLYIANLGDSRVVVGVLDGRNKIVAEQLTRDDNANLQQVRDELRQLHPEDPEIVVFENGAWRVKGIIQVSKAIGDLYLKYQEFALDHQPIVRPFLSTEPTISTRVLQPHDRFLIFASDGLWDHLSNQKAVDIVHRRPRAGIARRLVVTAQNIAANKSGINYNKLKRIDRERRRTLHDDITVVVLFLDRDFENRTTTVQDVSITGFEDADTSPSKFQILQES